MLDLKVFLMYFNAFYLCLDDSDGRGDLREKVIALKSIVDGLIIHGTAEDERLDKLFRLITN